MTMRPRSMKPKSLRTALPVALLVPAMLLGAAGAANACEGSEILFEDKFEDNLCGWPCSPNRGKVEDGKFTLRPKEGPYNYSSILPSYFFGDADVCVRFRFAKIAEGSNMAAGLLFWAENYKNNYGIKVYSNGKISIYREKDDKNSYMKVIKDAPEVKKGVGGENLIRATIVGSVVTLYVNGAEVHKFRAQKPGKESKIGLYVQGDKGINVAEFDQVKVTNVKQ